MTTISTDYVDRAIKAYFRSGGTAQPSASSRLTTVTGSPDRSYVHLGNVNGTLAVYRIQNNGVLKRLKKWPSSLDLANRPRGFHVNSPVGQEMTRQIIAATIAQFRTKCSPSAS